MPLHKTKTQPSNSLTIRYKLTAERFSFFGGGAGEGGRGGETIMLNARRISQINEEINVKVL